MADARECKESPLIQGKNEQIIYTLTTTPWGSSPTSVSVVVKDTEDDSNVSATVLIGSATVAGDVITLPTLKNLTLNHNYRIRVKFTINGQVTEAFIIVRCKE